MWDVAVVTEEDVYSTYLDLGYDEEHARKMTLWTKVWVLARDIRRMFSKGWIDEEGARLLLLDAGVPEERADEFMKTLVKAEKPERVGRERDLAKTDILRGFRYGELTREQTVELLTDLGWDMDEADYLVSLEELRLEREPRRLGAGAVLKAFRYGIRDEGWTRRELRKLGYTDDAVEVLIGLEKARLEDFKVERKRERDLTRRMIVDAVHAKIITLDTCIKYLDFLGYDEWEIDIILKLEGLRTFTPVG